MDGKLIRHVSQANKSYDTHYVYLYKTNLLRFGGSAIQQLSLDYLTNMQFAQIITCYAWFSQKKFKRIFSSNGKLTSDK